MPTPRTKELASTKPEKAPSPKRPTPKTGTVVTK